MDKFELINLLKGAVWNLAIIYLKYSKVGINGRETERIE